MAVSLGILRNGNLARAGASGGAPGRPPGTPKAQISVYIHIYIDSMCGGFAWDFAKWPHIHIYVYIYIYIYIYVDQIGLCFGHTRVLVLTRVLRLSWAGSEALVLRSEALLPTSRPDIYIYLLSLTSRRLSSYVKLMDLWCRKIVKPCQDLVLPNCHPIPQSVAYIYIYIYMQAHG